MLPVTPYLGYIKPMILRVSKMFDEQILQTLLKKSLGFSRTSNLFSLSNWIE